MMNTSSLSVFPIIVFLILLIPIKPLLSQNFKPGYIISKEGKRLEGFILYKDHRFNRQNCKFRESVTGKIKDYAPDALHGYGVNGIASFRSVERAVKIGKDWIFAEYLLEAKTSLLFYGSTFFIEQGNKIERLISGTETVNVDGRTLEKDADMYKRQLLELLSDCRDISGLVVQTKYNDKSLTKLLKAYYNCSGGSYTDLSGQHAGLQLSPGFAIRMARITTTFERVIGSTYYFEQNEVSWDQFLSPSFFIRISYPKIDASLALRLGIAYSGFSYSNSDVNDRAGIDLTYEMETKTSLVEIPANLVYSFSRLGGNGFSPYIFLGGSMNIPIKFEGERKTTSSSGTVLSRNSFRERGSFFSARAGLGLDIHISDSFTGFLEFFYDSSAVYAIPEDSQVVMYLKSLNLSLGIFL